jgi:hypothetical protein
LSSSLSVAPRIRPRQWLLSQQKPSTLRRTEAGQRSQDPLVLNTNGREQHATLNYHNHQAQAKNPSVRSSVHSPILSFTIPYVSNLSRILVIVSRVGGVVSNSCVHRLCTSNTLSNFQYRVKINLHCSNQNRTSAILRIRIMGKDFAVPSVKCTLH